MNFLHPIISLRRKLQQAAHSLIEAKDALVANDDPRLVEADLLEAQRLLKDVLKTVSNMADGARGGEKR